ncbi:MAG: hypothetical protein JW820_00980 [Spirochaetales bacterium]|nr:hypothetical protein [Spirochaetales bacterium]
MTETLRKRLPPTWSTREWLEPRLSPRRRSDLTLKLDAPDGTSAILVVEAKQATTTRDLANAARQLSAYLLSVSRDPDTPTIGMLAAPYVSPTGRQKLRECGVGYADLTGNFWLAIEKPAVFIETQGADRNPSPVAAALRSLRGRASGAAVRALVDFKAPMGLRELSDRAKVAAPTLSRVARLLENEGLLEREPDGSIASIDWPGVLRRWVQDYSLLESNRAAEFIAPRGLDTLLVGLRQVTDEAALTGTLGLPPELRVAPPRLAIIYSRNVARLAQALDIRPVDRGANVLLLEPFDPVVFARARRSDGLVQVAFAQLFADLSTAPGRAPVEADELLRWMMRAEDAWRS